MITRMRSSFSAILSQPLGNSFDTPDTASAGYVRYFPLDRVYHVDIFGDGVTLHGAAKPWCKKVTQNELSALVPTNSNERRYTLRPEVISDGYESSIHCQIGSTFAPVVLPIFKFCRASMLTLAPCGSHGGLIDSSPERLSGL